MLLSGEPAPGSAQRPSQEAEFLNVLLSFAQFEREVIGERIRDKIAAKKKGM
jgi:DNA invertase Pin-like site-specific DNA recombinase